jgi:chromosome segregation ATPase
MTEYEEELLETIQSLRAELDEVRSELSTVTYQRDEYESDLEFSRAERWRLEEEMQSMHNRLVEDIDEQRATYEERISEMENNHYYQLQQEREIMEERLQQEREYLEEQYRRDEF